MIKSKKLLKISLVLLLSISLTFPSFSRNNTVYALDPISAAVFSAIPLSWPLVATLLIAGGIGTAAYYHSLPESRRAEILEDIKSALDSAQKTLKYGLPAVLASGIVNAGDYIRGAITADGTNYIDQDTLQTIYEEADRIGLFNDTLDFQIESIDLSPYVGQRVGTLPHMVASDYILAIMASHGGATLAQQQAAQSIPDGIYMYTSYGNGRFNFVYNYYNSNITRVTEDDNFQYVNSYQPFKQLYIYDDGRTEFSGWNSGYEIKVAKPGSDLLDASNVGNIDIDARPVPVGEKGRVNIDDWSFPWTQGIANIDNYGDSLSIAIPSSISDVITWDASEPFPYSISLPDVLPDTADAETVARTQDDAQSGTADPAIPIPDVAGITPSLPALTLPAWVTDRFPFCLPFDLAHLYRLLTGGNRRAPIIDISWTLFLDDSPNQDVESVFDLAYFDQITAVVRNAQIFFFVLGLIKATKIYIF